MNQGRVVFAQVVELLPRRAFDNAVARYGGERRVKSLSCMDQQLKHRHRLTRETNDILQILSVTILEKAPVPELFSTLDARSDQDQLSNQLSLFEL